MNDMPKTSDEMNDRSIALAQRMADFCAADKEQNVSIIVLASIQYSAGATAILDVPLPLVLSTFIESWNESKKKLKDKH